MFVAYIITACSSLATGSFRRCCLCFRNPFQEEAWNGHEKSACPRSIIDSSTIWRPAAPAQPVSTGTPALRVETLQDRGVRDAILHHQTKQAVCVSAHALDLHGGAWCRVGGSCCLGHEEMRGGQNPRDVKLWVSSGHSSCCPSESDPPCSGQRVKVIGRKRGELKPKTNREHSQLSFVECIDEQKRRTYQPVGALSQAQEDLLVSRSHV